MAHFVRNRWYDHAVFLGDLLDFDALASQSKTSLRAVEGKRLTDDFRIGHEYIAEVMDAIRCQNPHATGALLEGNHEFRLHRYVDEHPALEGILDVPKALKLAELGVEWVPHWSKGALHEIGPTTFIHGDSHARNHASVNLRTFNRTVFYGHTHDCDAAWGRDAHGKPIVAQSMGHLCDASKMTWVRGRPVNWTMMFGEVFVPRWVLTGDEGQGPEFSYTMNRMSDDGSFIDSTGRLWGPKGRVAAG
jgi:hypothetical protein